MKMKFSINVFNKEAIIKMNNDMSFFYLNEFWL